MPQIRSTKRLASHRFTLALSLLCLISLALLPSNSTSRAVTSASNKTDASHLADTENDSNPTASPSFSASTARSLTQARTDHALLMLPFETNHAQLNPQFRWLKTAALVSTPSISSISPSSPIASSSNQNVSVFGSNFQSGLTVTITFPSGGSTTLSGTQIQSVTSTSFVMVVTLNSTGTWSIRVNNPDGGQSGTFFFTVQSASQPPSISSISPSSPTTSSSNQNITVFGSNFQSGLTVTVTFPSGSSTTLSGSQIQSVTSTSFVMVITLNASGTWSIRVNNPNGSQSNTFSFSVQAAIQPPSISSISPTTPTASSTNQNVTVFGSNFQSGLTVTVTFPNGSSTTLSGSQIQSVTSGSFVMVVSLNATGTWSIRVNNPDGGRSNTFSFTVRASVPTISSISPSSLIATPGNQNVTVNGANFQSGLTVTVTFPSGQTSTLSGTQIQSVTSSSFVMVISFNGNPGSYSIRVNNPDGGQSNTISFTVQPQVIAPTISSISPASPTATVGNQNLTVNGSNFQSGLTVTVTFPNGQSSTLSGTQIQSITSTSFVMVINFSGNPGSYSIRVNNPDGGQSNTFSFNAQQQVIAPLITSISPSSPTALAGNQNVTVNGSRFQSGLTGTVTFPNGQTGTLSGTQIQSLTSTSFVLVISFNSNPGSYSIRVNNPDGGQSNVFSFTVQPQVQNPVVSAVSPASPTAIVGNQNISVSGSNFQQNLIVTVIFPNGQTSTLSGTQIQSVTATSFVMMISFNGNPGNYSIRVNNPDGGQSNTFGFTVQPAVQPPTISSISPLIPTANGSNQNVTVFGTNFQQNLTVSITFPSGGGTTLSGTQIQSVTSTSFVMVGTLNSAGSWSIRVNNPDGGQSNVFSFTVQSIAPAPAITSISPGSPSASNADQNVTIFGSNFQQNLTVSVTFPNGGGATLSGTQIQSVTSNSFVMRITFGGAGSWSIRVNNPDGGQSNTFNFTVLSVIQPPTISSLNPSNPFASSNDQDVVVFGSNFQPNLTVSVTFPSSGGTTLRGTQIQNVTSSSFVLRITLNAPGNWSIRVNNPDGGQSSIFNFNVSGGGQNPVISSINPGSPMTSGADQNVLVNGSNFQPGLRVDVSFPNGGLAALQGTGQIQNVTANSFLMRITLNGAGPWTIRVVNPDGTQSGQFNFNVQASGPQPSNLPASVLSPVIGPLRVTISNQAISDGKWEFDQHKTGFHTPTGGISLSNDTFAWDVNLYTPTSGNADAGKAVFAVADGEVVSFVGTPPGGGPGAVLIAHPNRLNPVWFSGYLHMTNVRVSLNQQVNSTTVIGEIGRVGAENDHLHFVVYSGQNTRGNLLSFNATIIERSTSATNPPTITSIEPNAVNQSSVPQLIMITGSNFQSNSIIEGQSSNRQYFTITSETISGLGDESKIVSITPSTITALVNFSTEGTYEFSVINRPTNPNLGNSEEGSFAISSSNSGESSFAVSGSNTVRVIPSGRTPVILIPGIMGSRVAKREGDGFRNLWLGGSDGDQRLINNRELKNNVEDPNVYRDISQRPVVATEILRNLSIQGTSIPSTDVYDRLISYLIGKGYTEYDVNDTNGVPNPNKRTINGCDTGQVGADLFVFPYDWRNSNWTSARDLYEYVQCIKKIRGNPASFKVHIIAHSMGGLVARRYILNNPGTHYVDRMVTLGTPWLGAPKFLNTMEFGGKLLDPLSLVILPPTIKEIAPYIKGAHELIPSKAYVDDLTLINNALIDHPLGEDGWDDFDFDPKRTPVYDFSHLRAAMNVRYANRPGDTTNTFHSQPGQDDWRGDSSGVSYYNFVGYGKNTTVSLIAKRDWIHGNYFEQVQIPDGDGTVPLLSALRKGRQDYRGPIRIEKGFPLNHGELASENRPQHGSTFPYINCVVNVPDADACINNISSSLSLALRTEAAADFTGEPNYLLKVLGPHSVIISDSFGNTTNPLSTSIDEGVRTVQTDVTGDAYLSATFPLDQNYRVVLKSPATPLSILLTKSDGQNVNQAIRYVDITLPPNVLALLEITPQGVAALKYDSDGNGTFDTSVNPTISVTGTPAQDIEPPVVTVKETVQAGTSQIVFEAMDTGTGVQRIMYSVDGTTYQPYVAPLTLNPSQTPVIYAFADDNVANRSGLVTYRLTTLASAIQLNAPSYSLNEGDGRAAVIVTRSGDISGSASIDYRTVDTDTFTVGCADTLNNHGGAYARCDFATVAGTLQFAAGETSKTITVPVIDDAYVEGDETFQVILSNPTGATLSTPGTATVTIKDNDTAGALNPIFASSFFVRQQYLDFLSREPDQGGFNAWLGVLNNCSDVNNNPNCDRILVSQSFFGSPEFQLKGLYVFRFYKLGFNRLPEYPEIIADMSFVAGSTAQEVFQRKAQLVVNFTQRQEFVTNFGTLANSDYVAALLNRYQLTQITTVDPANPDGTQKVMLTNADLVSQLNSGALTRAQVFRAIADSEQVGGAEFNNAFVAMQYYGYLRRKPETAGYQAWLRVLQSGDIRAMVNGFMNSAEYRLRFGIPNQ